MLSLSGPAGVLNELQLYVLLKLRLLVAQHRLCQGLEPEGVHLVAGRRGPACAKELEAAKAPQDGRARCPVPAHVGSDAAHAAIGGRLTVEITFQKLISHRK